ncbi:hypothetical protein Poli38472_004897 [Pythium oligandrum]|uniref:Uncharacterized protein n=1 Tax=Pythium oligandrum TaxID=41045 RepID=A0A8K1CBX0_PYTOL|nr:hypothetical protein Poli38472_004897 [Pythium oligandrum]|eukprot:TMW59828.1 hypothetical protein Poli38472_004897 [Pythium oligandrum]
MNDECDAAVHAFLREWRLHETEEATDDSTLLFPSLDDDQDVFNSLLLDHDGDSTVSANEIIQTNPTTVKKTTTKERNSNPSWSSKREELIYLRVPVKELEGKLEELRAIDRKLESADTEPDELIKAVWEDVARRQCSQPPNGTCTKRRLNRTSTLSRRRSNMP